MNFLDLLPIDKFHHAIGGAIIAVVVAISMFTESSNLTETIFS